MNNQENTGQSSDWVHMATTLYGKLSGINAEVSFNFENLEIDMPGKGPNTPPANWRLNGVLRIRTRSNESGQGNSNQ